jgi:hypothetical protein
MGKNKNIKVMLENGIDLLSANNFLFVLPNQSAIIPKIFKWVDFEFFYTIGKSRGEALIDNVLIKP